MRIHEYLMVDNEGYVRCLKCGYALCRADEADDYKKYAASRRLTSSEIGRKYFWDNRVLDETDVVKLVAYYCPNCGVQLDVDVEEA